MANEVKSGKKPFDKKKWRNEKYSKKVKGKTCQSTLKENEKIMSLTIFAISVDQWQDKRKKYIQSKYFRMLQKEGTVQNPNMAPLGKQQKSQQSDR